MIAKITQEQADLFGLNKIRCDILIDEANQSVFTCQVRNLDTGELKTMTRESAKLLQAETKDVCDWLTPCQDNCYPHPFSFNESGIYTYKLKPNLVKLDGKLMTREAAIALWESKKDTCDVWYQDDNNREMLLENPIFKLTDSRECNPEYFIRPKPTQASKLERCAGGGCCARHI